MNNDKMLTRIGNLLRQAEGTDNQSEADAFTETAQRLATTHSVSLELARAAAGARDKTAVPITRHCVIGERGKKGLRTYVSLMLAIATNNNVRCDIAHNSTFVIRYGFESDIDVVDALYASLIVQMVKASEVYLQSGDWKNTKIQRLVPYRDECGHRYQRWETRTPNRLQARIEFQAGYSAHIDERLSAAREQATRDIDATNGVDDSRPGSAPSAELVLKGKDVAVADHYKKSSVARGSYRANSRATTYSQAARDAGAAAAAKAQIGEQATLGGSARKLTA
ncbi:DUF2786 domain-containing protein [Gordonia aichiensis]|uniref:DUF2786 domain-containing protein n=1 Tax=Gordonia aichiensis TaxID=36820 RepID=UPI003266BAFF